MSFGALLADVVLECAPLVVDSMLSGESDARPARASSDGVSGRQLRKVVNDATARLASLIDSRVEEVIEELRASERRSAVRDLKAHVESLHSLLGLKASDEEAVRKMVAPSIGPLQVSVNRAREVLREQGSPEFALYCEILGMSALVAGHEFVGVDASGLRAVLESRLREATRTLLEQVAMARLEAGEAFPWEQVSAFLSLRGIEELKGLYLEARNESDVTEDEDDELPDITKLKVAEAKALIAETSSRNVLVYFAGREFLVKEYEARDSVIGAIKDRIAELAREEES